MPEIQTYQPSGKIAPYGPFLAIPAGILSGASVGWLYMEYSISSPFVGLVAPVVFGLLTGILARYTLRIGKCRGRGIGLFLGGLLGTAAVATTHYLMWQKLSGGSSFLAYIEARTASGAGWDVMSLEFTGGLVWVIWVIEWLIVAGISALASLSVTSRPFCEDSNSWSERRLLGNLKSVKISSASTAVRKGLIHDVLRPVGHPDSRIELTLVLYESESSLHLSAGVGGGIFDTGGAPLFLALISLVFRREFFIEVLRYACITEEQLILAQTSIQLGPRFPDAPPDIRDAKLPAKMFHNPDITLPQSQVDGPAEASPKLAPKQQQLGAAKSIPKR